MADMSYDEIVAFAQALVDADELTTVSDLMCYFEKPWKWRSQFELWQRTGNVREAEEDDDDGIDVSKIVNVERLDFDQTLRDIFGDSVRSLQSLTTRERLQ